MSWSLVQDVAKATKDSGDFTHSVYTIATPTAGNVLVLLVQNAVAGSSFAVTGVTGGGVTWAKIDQADTVEDAEIWWGANSSGSGSSITVTNNGAGSIPVNILEAAWSGGATGGAQVEAGTAGSNTHSGTGAAVNSGTITPSSGLDALLVVAWVINVTATHISGPTGGFTNLTQADTNLDGGAAWQSVASTSGSYTYTDTYSNNYKTHDACIAAITIGGGGGFTALNRKTFSPTGSHVGGRTMRHDF